MEMYMASGHAKLVQRRRYLNFLGTVFSFRLDTVVYNKLHDAADKWTDGSAAMLLNNWFHQFLEHGVSVTDLVKAKAVLPKRAPKEKAKHKQAMTVVLADVAQIKKAMKDWRHTHIKELALSQEELVELLVVHYMLLARANSRSPLRKPYPKMHYYKFDVDAKLPWPMTWMEADAWAWNRNDPKYTRSPLAGLDLDTDQSEPEPQPQPVAQAPITRPDDHPPTTRPNGFTSLVDALNAKVPQEV